VPKGTLDQTLRAEYGITDTKSEENSEKEAGMALTTRELPCD